MTDTVLILPGDGSSEPGLLKTGSSGTILTQGSDVVTLPLVNYWASTEASDTFSAIGYPGYKGPYGQFSTTENTDTLAAVGHTSILVAWKSTDTPDIFGASGRLPIQGPWVSTGAADTMVAAGRGFGQNGIWASTEATDIFAGSAGTPIAGTFVTTEYTDRFVALGAGAKPSQRRRQLIVA